jgi:hypothetical protein
MVRAITALAFLAAASATSCGSTGVQTGSALVEPVPTHDDVKPMIPGHELGILDVDVDNVSGSMVMVSSVGITGTGVGSVIRVVEVRMAPLRIGRHHYVDATPGGLYETDPPVFLGKTCHKQTVFPVHGFRMPPGTQSRLWIVVRFMHPGKWVIPAPVIYYSTDGNSYKQSIPAKTRGSVAADAAYIPPYDAHAKCVGPVTGAHFLAGYHRGAVSH